MIREEAILNLKKFIIMFLGTIVMAQNMWSCIGEGDDSVRILRDAFDRPILVRDVVDICQVMSPEEFWSHIKPEKEYKRADINLWESALIRMYFFGKLPLETPVRCDEYNNLPRVKGKLGQKVDFIKGPIVIAEDIEYNPIMKAHGTNGSYSNKYYPRRMGDYINSHYHPAYILTGEEKYLRRMCELLDYLLYSQYQEDGHNQFIKDHYPQDYTVLTKTDKARRWRGGWDYLFDWEWLDAYGYVWSLHEPDHHVNSLMAVAMIRGYEITGEIKYLESAAEFVYNMMPNYGFHTGIWKGDRYYWTEYNPTGSGNPRMDATDNIQSLVAQAVAMVGYYKNDSVLLEYARGLLWYIVREFKTDGRWYYDGAENPLNYRKAVSHDMAVLDPAIATMPYLIKGGVPTEDLQCCLLECLTWYIASWDSLKDDRFFKSWKAFVGEPNLGSTVKVVSYIQITNDKVKGLKFYDPIFRELNQLAGVKISRLIPSQNHETGLETGENKILNVIPDLEFLEIPMKMKAGDIFKIEYEWVVANKRYLDEPSRMEALVDRYGLVVKGSSVVKPGLIVDGDNLLYFPETLYFPRDNL